MTNSPRRARAALAAIAACIFTFTADTATAQAQTAGSAYRAPRALDGSTRGGMSRPTYAPPAPIWAGFYAGAHGGYGWGSVDAKDVDLGSVRTNGGIAGLHVGYNWQKGDIVAGLEGDLSAGWVDGHRIFASGLDMTGKADWTSSVRGRFGYSFSNVLVYATGGVAFGKQSVSVFDGIASYSDSRWQTGYVVGGGIEAKLTPTMSVRTEVLHYGFGDKDYSIGGVTVPVRGDETVVRGGLSLHFN